MKKSSYLAAGLALVVLIGAAAYWWRQQHASTTLEAPAVATPSVVQPAASAASQPGIQYPIDAPADNPQAATPPDMDTALADNGLRYTPFVLLMETVDLPKAAATYARLYPIFQQAYEDIGFPKRYFNDRLVAVIDQLLATPDVTEPLKIRLPQINGPLQLERPWVLYEFEDPALQSLSAGQKILLRMGPVNERRMKSKLAEIRRLVTAGSLPR